MTATLTDRLYGASSSVAVKAPVVAVASANAPLSGLTAITTPIGSYTPNECDRILVVAQADPSTNGIYNASQSAWQRTGDFDGVNDAVQGTLVIAFMQNSLMLFYQLVTADPVIGTTSLAFVPFGFNPNYSYPQTVVEVEAGVTPTNYSYPADPYVDPRRYGADPSGTVDSTVAVQTAINVAYKGKGTVWIGLGCSYLVGALTLSPIGDRINDGFIMRGSAPNGSCLVQNGAASAILTVTGATPTGAPQEFPLKLTDFAIKATSSATDGIALIGVSDSHVENVVVSGANRAIYGNSCLEATVRNCWLSGNQYGIYVRRDGAGASPNLWRLEDSAIDNNAIYGVDYDQGSEFQARGNDIEQNGTVSNSNTGAIHIGSSINASPTFGFAKIWLENNWLEDNTGGYAIQVDAPTAGQSTWISVIGGHTVSTVNGTAVNIAGTGAGGHVDIKDHYSPSPGDTWLINSTYASLKDVEVNVLTDTVTYPTYTNVVTSAVNHINGRYDTFTATLTGCTTSPTGTVSVHQQGDEIVLDLLAAIQAVSDTDAATLTGLPAKYEPANTNYGVLTTVNNGNSAALAAQVSGAVITLGYGQSFTSSGNKGIIGGQLRYRRS